MKLIERYIFRRAFGIFIGALLSVLAIVWMTQALTRINLVTDSGQSAAAFLELATLMLPSVVPEVIPFAVAIAAAHTLSSMNVDSELSVIGASGASRSAIYRPILVLALLACVTSFVFANVIDPATKTRFRELLANAHGDLLSTFIQEGSFRKVEDGLYVQIGERLPSGRLGELVVIDSRADDLDLIYYAREGSVVSGDQGSTLLMSDGEVHRRDAAGEVSVVRFTSYAFDLSQFSAATGQITYFAKDRSLAFLLNPDTTDRVYQQTPQAFRAELHKRFTDWLYGLVFALVALAVAGDARSHREARVHPLITALLISLLIRWAGYFVVGKAQSSAAWIPVIYLVIAAGVLLPVWFMATNRTMELPTRRTEQLATIFEKARARLSYAAARSRALVGAGPAKT
ncbi:MAG: LptF/LptG family permease [Rhizobiaceae bacterium]|nr:LptF/LptG family permease [Rhizobiaceae bacterium]MCV0406457.1 LptF/LptG family permease [Rhizobiaceae bacterium]